MSNTSGITLAVRFYRKQNHIPKLGWMLTVTGISGILETLPILLSLPLIRTLFLNTEEVALGTVHVKLTHYVAGLLLLLVVRLIIGVYSQYLNAAARIALLADFRINTPLVARNEQKSAFGKSVQSINFLLVGWSQILPGILFMTAGIFLFPAFGGIIAGIALLWIIPLRTLKRRQDRAHETVSALQTSLDEDASNTEHWRDARFKAAKLDSYNKNLREFIIISTLILALVLSHNMHLSFAGNSLLVVLMLLRGMQQLFTGYIMAQQVAALKGFLKDILLR